MQEGVSEDWAICHVSKVESKIQRKWMKFNGTRFEYKDVRFEKLESYDSVPLCGDYEDTNQKTKMWLTDHFLHAFCLC